MVGGKRWRASGGFAGVQPKRWRASGGFAGVQPVACIRKTAVWDIHTRHLARNYPSFLSLRWSEETVSLE